MTPMLGIMASAAMGSKQSSYESIASQTLVSDTATVSFTSIPSTYKHLQLRVMAKHSRTANTFYNVNIQFNSDTGANYTSHYVFGNQSAVTASNLTSGTFIDRNLYAVSNASAHTSMFGVGIVDIIDYALTTKYKTVRSLTGQDVNGASVNDYISIASGLWSNTSAINRIDLHVTSYNLVVGSTFALYGIKGA